MLFYYVGIIYLSCYKCLLQADFYALDSSMKAILEQQIQLVKERQNASHNTAAPDAHARGSAARQESHADHVFSAAVTAVMAQSRLVRILTSPLPGSFMR